MQGKRFDIADTHVFRRYNITRLQQIVKNTQKIVERLDTLIELIKGTETEVVISREDFEKAAEEFGTTD